MTARTSHLKWIVCGGGMRCGSTLQYNLIGGYVEALGIGLRCGYGGHAWLYERRRPAVEGPLLCVAKSHPVDDWGIALATGVAAGLTTRRDEDDVRASMRAKFGDDSLFDESEAYRHAWAELSVYCCEYDELVENPRRELARMVRALDLPVQRQALDLAVEASDRRTLQAVAASLEPGDWDPLTLVHYDHFRDMDRT